MDAQTTLELQDLEASTGIDLDTLVQLISDGHTTEDNISEHVSNYYRGEFESRGDYIEVDGHYFKIVNWD